MMKYKWCICDMDGTLLNSKDEISKENVFALKKLQECGVEVIIATGRLDLMVKLYLHQLNLEGHVISCNGGLIRNIHTGEIVYANTMDIKIVREILSYCFEMKMNFLVYTANLMLSNPNNPRAYKYENLNKRLADTHQFDMKYLKASDMDILQEMDILKVLLLCDDHDEVEPLIRKFSNYKELSVVSSANTLVDIMAANTSKGRAIRELANKMQVNPDEIIAFGDNYNDIDMLQSVGMPIAMENSVEELKAVAKHITKSNDESGIAYAINQWIL